MRIFDNYIAVDWSANSSPKSGTDSIWIAWLSKTRNVQLFNPKTRMEALKLLKSCLKNSDGRVLVGFDFPFGYPKRFSDMLGYSNWLDVWSNFSKFIKDFKDNKNNRFEAAGYLNSQFWQMDHFGVTLRQIMGDMGNYLIKNQSAMECIYRPKKESLSRQ